MAGTAGGGKSGGGGSGTIPPRPGSGGRSAPKRPSGARPSNYPARPGARPTQRVSARQAVQQRRQRNIRVASVAVGLVVVVIAVFVVAKLAGGGSPKASGGDAPGTYKLSASLVREVTSVPVADLVKAAETAEKVDKEKNPKGTTVVPPYSIKGKAISSGGKPEMLFIGAEYCPYCAGERWAMAMALSKFGTLEHVAGTTSSSTDANASTPTFSFYHTTLKSNYLSFVPVETATNTEANLQQPTAAEDALQAKWDVPPYVQNTSGEGYPIPFVYIDGKFLIGGIQYDAGHIAGWNFSDAASYITAGNNPTSLGAEGAAGMMVADICVVTHNQPGSVCNAVPNSLKGFSMSSLESKGSSTVTTTTGAPATSTTSAGTTATTKKSGS